MSQGLLLSLLMGAERMGVENLAFRCALAALTAFVVSLALGWRLIRALRRHGVIEDTSQPDHAALNAIQSEKRDVPTMGGLMILGGILAALALWADLGNGLVQIGVFCLLALGVLGLADDAIKLSGAKSRGLRKRTKLLVQCVVGAVAGVLILLHADGREYADRFYLPFTTWSFGMGVWYVLWTGFLIAAASNAVNLTDGLDGLAGGCAGIAAAALLGFGCLVMRPGAWGGLSLPRVAGGEEMCVLAASVVGAALGFLWYNCHPAQIFMGDTGSLSLGGLLGFIALALKLDLLLFVTGLVLFADMLTVAMQIASYKLTRRRIFPITPIHHYFQTYLRWPEQKITVRLWIIAAVAVVASLAALKLG